MVVEDKDIMTVLDILEVRMLELRQLFFLSPEVDAARLRLRVEEFAKMGDKDVASKFMPLICRDADAKPSGNDSGDRAVDMPITTVAPTETPS